jgi:arsenite-transporting ATPase
VGKTSVAAATALRSAQRGMRTIVLSTDAAHSLGDCLDIDLSPEPLAVVPNLWGQESDVYYNIEKYWGTVQRWLQSVLAWEGVDAVLAEEIVVLPGMDELASLLWILEHQRSGAYDTIIVDCAPTAETFRLLTFPEAGRWWMDKIFPLSRRVTGVAGPLLRRLTDLPMPTDEVFQATEQLLTQIRGVQDLLNDPSLTSIRLVVNPENMVIKEAQRSFTSLSLYGYLTDLVVCNRVLPEQTAESYFRPAWEQQQRHLETIDATFAPVPVRRIPFFDREVTGLPSLELVADALFGAEDPTQFFWEGKPFTIERLARNGAPGADQPAQAEYLLSLSVPLAEREDLQLLEAGEEIVITVGQHRRNLLLPRALQGRSVLGAKLADGTLRVWFGGQHGFGGGTNSRTGRAAGAART